MKNCTLCGQEREDITVGEVAPATWNGFNNFAEVCSACRETRRFKTWAKTLTAPARVRAAARAAAEADEAAAKAAVEPAVKGGTARSITMRREIQISHRRTGILLHTVTNHTLAGADLRGAALSGADLQHATMRGVILQKADLHLADLTGADLRGADLRAANFRGADLRGTDLREARLYRADFSHSLFDAGTKWPAGFDPDTCGGMRHVGRS